MEPREKDLKKGRESFDEEPTPNELVPPDEEGALVCMAVAQRDPMTWKTLYYEELRSEVWRMYALQQAFR